MRRQGVKSWSWFLAAVGIVALGFAGCGGGGDGGGGGAVSSITRVGGNNNSGDLGAALSQTGRYVAFSSSATNMTGTGNDNNSRYDVFVLDRQTGDITVASKVDGTVSTKISNADDASFFPSISDDGTKVAFESDATNLIGPADPLNTFTDIYVHSRSLNRTFRASVALGGAPADNNSFKPSISGNGSFVAFHSSATNLVAGDTNGVSDVFIANISNSPATPATVTRVSGAAGGAVFGQAVSADGTRVAFESPPGGALKQIFVWTSPGPAAAITTGNGDSRISGISGNGRYVVFDSDASNLVANDNNGVSDVFVHDLTTGITERVSVSSAEAQAVGGNSIALGHRAISDDGNLVVFESDATNLGGTGSTNYYVRDRAAGTTTALAAVTGTFVSEGVTISGDGNVAAFVTDDGSIVGGDTGGFFDVFVMPVP